MQWWADNTPKQVSAERCAVSLLTAKARSCKRSDTLFQIHLLLFSLLHPANSLLQPAKKVRI